MSTAHTHKHPYHLVAPSPWPAVGAASAFMLAVGGILYMHDKIAWVLATGAGLVVLTMAGWWRDVVREAIRDKAHTEPVRHGLRIGMGLFIASEVMFFVAFFWAFFFNALGINPGMKVWPPEGIQSLPTWGIPFLNTLILLSSGGTLIWADHARTRGSRTRLTAGLVATILLGVTFLALQIHEYGEAAFGFGEGIYPSTFYMATGFHGFHVFVGVVFLSVCLGRARAGHFDDPKIHPVGFQAAEWYWHFVDVVWLFLFTWVYWWGN
ncbi:MAG: cytochrome c oxidase subunit 3 [Magnetospirillum sp. WYHS-4]